MARLPPSPRRLRLAHAAGLRPRSRWLGLAFVALILAGSISLAFERATAWLSASLAGALAGRWPSLPLALGLGFIVLLCVGALRRLAHPRGSLAGAPRSRSQQVGLLSSLLLSALALVLALQVLRPLVAGAARSVDAPLHALTELWAGWLARIFIAIGGVALLVGIFEWLLSRRQLWLALHLDADQARAEARSQSRRMR